ncbi:MAG TPA: hypothetical protein VE224_17075 [Pseudolabrys sp.]|nr:hypothetical protein [Pseudolabrys sp.]
MSGTTHEKKQQEGNLGQKEAKKEERSEEELARMGEMNKEANRKH